MQTVAGMVFLKTHCKQEAAALADKGLSIQVTGNITYNGKGFDEFRAVHTSSYVDQNDLHQPLLTVKETMDFAARVQGVGHKAGKHDKASSGMFFRAKMMWHSRSYACSGPPVYITLGLSCQTAFRERQLH